MPRQPNGQNKIYEGADGWWHTYVTVGKKPNGKLDRRHIRGKTATAVANKLEALKASLRIGHVPEVGASPTVATWLEHWLTVICPERVRPTTLQGYESKVRFRLIPGLGRHRLAKLNDEIVGDYFAQLRREGLSAATRLQLFRILSRALKVAMRRGKIPRNPCDLLDPPSIDRDEIKPVSAGNTTRLLDKAAERGLLVLVRWLIALLLGLRQGEVLGLRWQYVDLDGEVPTIYVRWALARLKWRHGCDDEPCGRRPATCPARHGGGLQFVPVKSKKSRRDLPIPPNLLVLLRKLRLLQREARLAAGSRWQDHDLVVCGPVGEPVDPRRDWEAFKELLIECQIGVVERTHQRGKQAGELYTTSTVRVHDGRHGAATSMRALGMDLREVMEWLGHSQISVTEIYTHVPAEAMQERARQMGALYVLQPNLATTGT